MLVSLPVYVVKDMNRLTSSRTFSNAVTEQILMPRADLSSVGPGTTMLKGRFFRTLSAE
jgi:hypothetical protein